MGDASLYIRDTCLLYGGLIFINGEQIFKVDFDINGTPYTFCMLQSQLILICSLTYTLLSFELSVFTV